MSEDTPTKYPLLFSPFRLREVELKNRVVLLPMGTFLAQAGRPSDRDRAFFEARAEAGVGLIITGGTHTHVTSTGRDRRTFEAFRSEYIDDFAGLVDRVHRHGTKIFGQLMHRGREANPADVGPLLHAPSSVRSPTTPVTPRTMSRADMDDITEGFVVSARNLVRAGYDGLELHGAHGYLLGEFLSPAVNRRDDEYGGSTEARAKFILEIAEAVRAELPEDKPLGIRISGEEEIEDGMDRLEACRLAGVLDATGLFDYLSVAVGIKGSYIKDMSHSTGYAVPLARALRQASSLPVIVSQRITHPPFAEEILENGDADLVGVARAQIADPEWVKKARQGQEDRILPCVSCLQECRTRHVGIGCMHNPTSGHEEEYGPLVPAEVVKRVIVVGAGPAGLEASRIAAERGHQVTVIERQREPGGQVRLAASAPNRAELDGVVSFRMAELDRLGVEVRLGVEATAESLLAEQPDAIVIATGAAPMAPNFPVAEDAVVLTVWDLFDPGQGISVPSDARTAVVIDDGNGFWEGCSSAELLAERGLAVQLITHTRTIAGAIPVESVGPLMQRLRRRNVKMRIMTAVSSVDAGSVSVYDPHRLAATRSLEEEQLPADVVVLAGPKQVNDQLRRQLVGVDVELHAAGDCLTPRQAMFAVTEGHRVGRAL